MEIYSYKILKVYRKNGRPSCVLKLSLPNVCSDNKLLSEFNLFYRECAAAYVDLAKTLAERYGETEVKCASALVNFEYVALKNVLKVERTFSFSSINKSVNKSFCDYFDTVAGVFIKRPKSVKKQRKIPSRNSEKYNKTD